MYADCCIEQLLKKCLQALKHSNYFQGFLDCSFKNNRSNRAQTDILSPVEDHIRVTLMQRSAARVNFSAVTIVMRE